MRDSGLIYSYEKAHSALTWQLGFDPPSKNHIPTYSQIVEAINPTTHQYLLDRKHNGIDDTLLITPCVNEDTTFDELLARAGILKDSYARSGQWSRAAELWKRAKNTHHNNGDNKTGWKVAFLLNDRSDPSDETVPANIFMDPGLVYPNKTAGQQTRSLRREAKPLINNGVFIRPITASEYVVDRYGIQQIDQPKSDYFVIPPDQHITITRFIQYPKVALGGILHCLNSANLVESLNMDPSSCWSRQSFIGIRRVVDIQLQKP